MGFTLIEILIVITITVLLVGGGIAAFINFNERQAILNSAKEVQIFLRSAQTKAKVGQKPTGCNQLEAYRVSGNVNGNTLQLLAVCVGAEVAVSDYSLPDNLVFQSGVDLSFLVLQGGVSAAQTVSLESTRGYHYEFEVTQGGEITQGELSEI